MNPIGDGGRVKVQVEGSGGEGSAEIRRVDLELEGGYRLGDVRIGGGCDGDGADDGRDQSGDGNDGWLRGGGFVRGEVGGLGVEGQNDFGSVPGAGAAGMNTASDFEFKVDACLGKERDLAVVVSEAQAGGGGGDVGDVNHRMGQGVARGGLDADLERRGGRLPGAIVIVADLAA